MATALKDKLVTLEDLQQAYSKLKGELDDMGAVSAADITISGDIRADFSKVKKYGKIVEISIRCMYFDGGINGSGMIPDGYRPITDVFIPSPTSYSYGFLISPDGTLTLKTLGSGSNYAQSCNSFYICA